jgi:hypothetical protein
MMFMLPDRALPDDAEVAVVMGLHQTLGGPFKLIYLYRHFKCLHVYEIVSHGREFFWTLHMTTDTRYTLLDLQPSAQGRKEPYPRWWQRGAGSPYPTGGPQGHICTNILRNTSDSLVIVRDASHVENLSGGDETLVPAHLLLGLVPSSLLETYRFWQDQTHRKDYRANGERTLRGYPLDDATATIIIVKMAPLGDWQRMGARVSNPTYETTGLPGRTVKIMRKSKEGLTRSVQKWRRIANFVENHRLIRTARKKTVRKRLALEDALADDTEDSTEVVYAVGEQILGFDNSAHTKSQNPEDGGKWGMAQVQLHNPANGTTKIQ